VGIEQLKMSGEHPGLRFAVPAQKTDDGDHGKRESKILHSPEIPGRLNKKGPQKNARQSFSDFPLLHGPDPFVLFKYFYKPWIDNMIGALSQSPGSGGFTFQQDVVWFLPLYFYHYFFLDRIFIFCKMRRSIKGQESGVFTARDSGMDAAF